MMAASMMATTVPLLAGDGWTRGSAGVLAFDASFRQYSFTWGGAIVWSSTIGSLVNVSGPPSQTHGDDPIFGSYDELTLPFGNNGSLAVRYLSAFDGFIFTRQPSSSPNAVPTTWPSFSLVGTNATNTTRCIQWAEHFFFPGQVMPRTAHTNPQPFDLRQCDGGSGPVLFFESDPSTLGSAPAMALSPLSHFTCQRVANCAPHHGKSGPPPFESCALGVSAGPTGGPTSRLCRNFTSSSLLLARPGLTRTLRALGSLLRQQHNTTRARGPGVTQLSYWSDNQAGYSWWTVGNDQQVWGKPEDIYLTLAKSYTAAGIPVRGWEPDNNFVVDYQPIKNWKGVDLKAWNATLYPSGGEGFVSRLGSALGLGAKPPHMVYYTNGFTKDTVHQNGTWKMVKANGGLEPHPSVAYDFYADLWGNAARKYAMGVLFTDFLCYRGPSMAAYQDGLPEGEEGERLWLHGMTRGASDAGAEVQWCMATAHQVMATLELGGVTNVRVNGDGGLDVNGLTLPSLLAATVGLSWSKDNLRTADRCYVDGLYPNGTLKWPCGSINHGEGTSGQFKMQYQQTLLAALSLGPVGISDQLSARPDNASAAMTSNSSLVMATCAASGDLLQPSYPLTPTERSIAKQLGSQNAALWATYTALGLGLGLGGGSAASSTTSPAAAIWFTALGFCVGRGNCETITLREVDLAVMVDSASPPHTSFSAVPRAAFTGEGGAFDASTAHVWWRADVLTQQAAPGCGGVQFGVWNGSLNMSVSSGDAAALVNVAPLLTSGVALLGELGKAAAVSTYRFTSVGMLGSAVEVEVRGKPGEVVTLLFVVDEQQAALAKLRCVERRLTVGANGTAATSVAAMRPESSE